MQNFGQILLGVPDLDALNLRAELMAPFSLQLCACAVQQEIKPTYLLACWLQISPGTEASNL